MSGNPGINNISPLSGRLLRENGGTINIADLLAYITSGAGLVQPANYLYVGKNGSDTDGDGSANSPYLTVQKAIDVAIAGTTIFIWPGTYAENVTFKASVFLASPSAYSVYITGNHTANFLGTVILDRIVLGSSSGDTLTFSGSSAQNLQLLHSSVNSTSGHAINWTNTNASSKLTLEDSASSVEASGTNAKCFNSTSTAKGTVIANRYTFKVNNPDNVAFTISGAIAFYHTSDQVIGQIAINNTATYICALVSLATATVPVMTINSTGTSILSSVLVTTTSSPAFTGNGGIVFVAVEYTSTGVGGSSTLNGGQGAIPLAMAPIRLRSSALYGSPTDGTFEYDGTNLYFSVGTTRYKVTLSSG